jgi:hypothetical protein
MFDFSDVVYTQKTAIAHFAPRLHQLRAAVNLLETLPLVQWAQFYGLVHYFKPDLIIELGRHYGNSTTVFTEAANEIGSCRIFSIDLDAERPWERLTVPRLQQVVSPNWFAPLTAVYGDIMQTDFAPIVGSAKRILVFWDAHGYDLARYIEGHLLPLLEGKEHLVMMHDVVDTRYGSAKKSYGHDNEQDGFWCGYLCGEFEELIALYDFTSRNGIRLHTIDEDVLCTLKLDGERWSEVETEWAAAYSAELPLVSSKAIYFRLNDRELQHQPIHYPPPPTGTLLTQMFRLGKWTEDTVPASLLMALLQQKVKRRLPFKL